MQVIVTGPGPAPERFRVAICYDADGKPEYAEVEGWFGAFANLMGLDTGRTAATGE